MKRPDLGVRLRRKKREQVRLDLPFLHFADGFPPSDPDPGEERQRPVLTQRKPCRWTFTVGLRLRLAERRKGHQAAVVRAQPASPMRRFGVSDIGNARIGLLAL